MPRPPSDARASSPRPAPCCPRASTTRRRSAGREPRGPRARPVVRDRHPPAPTVRSRASRWRTPSRRRSATAGSSRSAGRRMMEDPDGIAHVLRTGRSLLFPEIPDELLAEGARDPEHLRVMREMELRSCMIVPLRGRGRVLGALSFVNDSEGSSFDEEDLGVAEELAARAAAAVENARLYSHVAARSRDVAGEPAAPAPAGRSPGSSWRGATARPARTTMSAGTSTTSSPSPRMSGRWSSATCAAREPRRRRSRR